MFVRVCWSKDKIMLINSFYGKFFAIAGPCPVCGCFVFLKNVLGIFSAIFLTKMASCATASLLSSLVTQ